MFFAEATVPFGLVGVLVVVGFLVWVYRSRSPQLTRECPHCKKRLRGDAAVCPHCQHESVAWVEYEGRMWRQDTAGQWEHRKLDGGPWLKLERDPA